MTMSSYVYSQFPSIFSNFPLILNRTSFSKQHNCLGVTKKPNEAEKASRKDDKNVVTRDNGKSKVSIANKDIEETSSKGKGVLMKIVLFFYALNLTGPKGIRNLNPA